jgi:alkanesulfonate monooxygenase SsuD/methylene tetrahydromethanopterin reductase-like flavin-dependent oxidoreductase (luciferase family)
MKISLFLELPLPKPWDEGAERRMFEQSLDLAELADQLGFHAVWVTEHHFLEEYSHASAPEVFLGAVSQRTKELRLGHGIMHTPPAVNHPARVAERISTLDIISGGRVEFGTGESSTVGELEGFQLDPGAKREQWDEGLRVALRCMVESPFTGFEGKHVSMPPRNVIPKPVQKPHPPVWVACTRHATVQMAAERGLGALSFSFVGPDTLAERVREYYSIFEDRCVPMGYTANPNMLALAGDMPLMCAPTEEQAISRLGVSGGFFGYTAVYYYNSTFGLHKPGQGNLWEQYLSEVEKDPSVAYGPSRGAVGTPEFVSEWFQKYEESGVDELMCLISPHEHEATMESLQLVGEKVLPEFLERDEATTKAKGRRLEPAIERAMARRVDDSPPFDPSYEFGGIPQSKSGVLADEALIAHQEVAEGRKAMAERAAALERLGRDPS